MSESGLEDCGRLTVPKEIRERFGDLYHIVELHDGVELVAISEDPFDALHIVESDGDTIVSTDEAYHVVAERLDLRIAEE